MTLRSPGRVLALALASIALGGCGDGGATPADTLGDGQGDTLDDASPGDTADDGSPGDTADAADGAADADTILGDEVYGPHDPPAGEVAEALRGAGWTAHYEEDLEPFWTMSAALGTPVGNFPTYRAMNGLPTGSTRRRPRMISRQIFAYVAGYLMTGDAALLGHAQAGVTWLREHAIDRVRGGCYPELEADGSAADGVRTAQDEAYCMLGLAAWVFLTRDAEAEADLLAGRDLLFDPARFWDADNGRIKDALDATLGAEVDVENDGGWELVAQLDPINAFLLLTQPVLSRAEDRARFLDDMRTLGSLIVERFAADGFIWGVSSKKGEYRSKHADFGHSMKATWMLLEIDKRLADHPFHDFVAAMAEGLVTRAFDPSFGRWAKRPTSATSVEFGSDWWIYAEADQLTATLNLVDGSHDARLAETQAHWLTDYVDRQYAGEVVPSVARDGSWVYPWPVSDTAKCNEWKNGYHSSEHALVLTILGRQREGAEVALHFAVPPEAAESFIARPYIFHGREVERVPGAALEVGGRALREVTVRFRDVY